jgi:F-type H+-transporting ATPase subunit alpha
LVLNLEYQKVSAIVLDTDINIKPGQLAICSGILMRVPTGKALLGRIIDPLGNPIDI